MEWLSSWAVAFWSVMLEAGLWLLVGFTIAGLIRAFVPTSLMQRWLGSGGFGSVIRASAIGIPMPLCSCSVIPAAASLRRAGASRGASTAFVVSTPEIDAPSISITYAMIGPVMAIARPVVAFATAMAAGIGVDRFARKDPQPAEAGAARTSGGDCCGPAAPAKAAKGCCEPAPASAAGDCCGPAPATGCCSGEDGAGAEPGPIRRALRHVLIELPGDLGHWMLIGLALSAVVMVLVPDGWIEQHLETGAIGPIATKLLMLGVGIPLYVCAASSTPLVAALMAKGLSPGAALIFLLAGPATNPATMAWVLADLGKRALAVYLTVIGGAALIAGFALDAVLPAGLIKVANVTQITESAGPTRHVAAAALLALLGWGVARQIAGRITSWRKRSASRRSPLPDRGSPGMTGTASDRPG